MTGVVAGGVAFLVAGALVPLLVRFAVGRNLLDVPNLRSSHEVPTPRLGGVAIFLGRSQAWRSCARGTGGRCSRRRRWSGPSGWPTTSPASTSASRPSSRRWPPPACCSSIRRRSSRHAPGVLGALVFVVGVFWIVALSNAFNFMDGIDGFTGGVALVNALFLAPLVGHGGWFLARAHRRHRGVLDLEHKPRIHLPRGLRSLLPRLQPGRGSPLRPRALGAGVDTSRLPGLRGRLHALPLRHRLYAAPPTRSGAGKNIFLAHREHIYQRITPTTGMHRRTSNLYYGLSVIAGFAALLISRGDVLSLAGVALALACCASLRPCRSCQLRSASQAACRIGRLLSKHAQCVR